MPETKEWTLMFYFASDNPLAPSIVSQLKALKNAGFHSEANVIARFDPHTEGTPLHTFDINHVLKAEALATNPQVLNNLRVSAKNGVRGKLDSSRHDAATVYKIGFPPSDPYTRNLVLDKLWGDETIISLDGKKDDKIEDRIRTQSRHAIEKVLGRRHGLAGDEIERLLDYDPPDPNKQPETPGKRRAKSSGKRSAATHGEAAPMPALEDFLKFCAREYPARHYMLFILGHGLVVGNAMFLFDEHAAKPSLSLGELSGVLDRFNQEKKVGDLELLAFHSCSMSSIEVAYELQGKARYMMASQGPEFVGSMPYTQILVRIFNDLKNKKKDIESTVKQIFSYCYYNSYDFQLAGYSFDLALCDLSKLQGTTPLINKLSSTLKDALDNEVTKDLILLAHWDAQSFWRDTYTDLFDFCLCLKRRCKALEAHVSEATEAELKSLLKSIQEDCQALMNKLLPEGSEEDRVILCAGFAGPSHQYAHGLSVFFPWAEPSNKIFWREEYQKGYKFKEAGWHEFLQQYFDKTMRDPRRDEHGHHDRKYGNSRNNGFDELDEQLLEGMAAKVFASEPNVQLGKGGGGDGTGKGGGGDASGDDCDCPPIKNYPSYTRTPHKKKKTTDERKVTVKDLTTATEDLVFVKLPPRAKKR